MKHISLTMLFCMAYTQADDNWSIKPKPPEKSYRPTHLLDPHAAYNHHDRHAPLASRFAHAPLHSFDHELLASLHDLSGVEYRELQSYSVERWRDFFRHYQPTLIDQQQNFLCGPVDPLIWQESVMKFWGLYSLEHFRTAVRMLPDYDHVIIALSNEIAADLQLQAQLPIIDERASQLSSLYQKVVNTVFRHQFDIRSYIAQEAHAAQHRIYDRWIAQQTEQAKGAVTGTAKEVLAAECRCLESQLHVGAAAITSALHNHYNQMQTLLNTIQQRLATDPMTITVCPRAQPINKPLVTADIKHIRGFVDTPDLQIHRHHMIGTSVHGALYDYARHYEHQLQTLIVATNSIKDRWQRHAICYTAQTALKEVQKAYKAVEEHELIDALEYLQTATQLHAHTLNVSAAGDQQQVTAWQQQYDAQLQRYMLMQSPGTMLNLDRFKEHQQRCQELRDACAQLHADGAITKHVYQLAESTYRMLQKHNIAPMLIEQCVGNHFAQVHHTQMIDLLERTAQLYEAHAKNSLVQQATHALCSTSVQATCSAQRGNIPLMMALDQTAHALFDMVTACLQTVTEAPMVQACLQGAYDGAQHVADDIYYVATHLPELGTSLCKLIFESAQLCTMLDDMPSMSQAEFQAKARSCADQVQAWCTNLHTTIAQIPTMSYAQLRDCLAYNSSYVIAQTCMLDGMFRMLKGAIEVGHLGVATASKRLPALKNSLQNSLSAGAQALKQQELNVLGMLHREHEVAQLAGIEHEVSLMHFNGAPREQHGIDAIASKAGEIEAAIENIEHGRKISALPPLPEGYSQVNLPRPVYKTVKGTGENCRIVRPIDVVSAELDWSPMKYAEIRNWTDDIERIAHNTGWQQEKIKRIKDYIFYEEHILDRGTMQFCPDPEIAAAWDRMYVGDFVQNDIQLLEHEYFELIYEKTFKSDYRTAHKAAQDKITGKPWDIPIYQEN